MYILILMTKNGPLTTAYENLEFAHEVFNEQKLLPGERKQLKDEQGNLLAWEARYSKRSIEKVGGINLFTY